jgi:hypothetical protein
MVAGRIQTDEVTYDAEMTPRITLKELLDAISRIEAGEPPVGDLDPPADESPLTAAEAAQLRDEIFKLRRIEPPLRCMAPVTPTCRLRPIGSHSQQRRGPLALLDDGTGHVLRLTPQWMIGHPRCVQFERIGVQKASTFPGLCAMHDGRLWRPIDTAPLTKPSGEQIFLLSYRTVLRELYVARWSRTLLTRMLTLAVREGNRRAVAFGLAQLTRANWGGARLVQLAQWYRKLYEDKKYSQHLLHLAGRNLWLLPFGISSFFEPIFYPDGSRVPPGMGPRVGPFLTLNVIPQEGGSVVIFTYASRFRSQLHAFLEPLRPPIDALPFVERVWEIALRYCENILLAPKYWDGPVGRASGHSEFSYCSLSQVAPITQLDHLAVRVDQVPTRRGGSAPLRYHRA